MGVGGISIGSVVLWWGVSDLGVWFCGERKVGDLAWGFGFMVGGGGGSDLGLWFCDAGWGGWGRTLHLIG